MPTVHQWERSRMLKCPGRIVSTEAPWTIRTSSQVHILVKKILLFPASVTHLWWSVGTFVTTGSPVGFISSRRQPCFVLSSPAAMSSNLLLGCQNPNPETHISYCLVTSCSWGEMRMEKVLKFKTIWIHAICKDHFLTFSHYSRSLIEKGCPLFVFAQVGVDLSNSLWAVSPPGNFCRVANAQACWDNIRRRSYLSFTPSDIPRCLFQTEYEQCDTWQRFAILFGLQNRFFLSFILWGFCLLLSKNDKRLARPRSTTEDALQLLSGEASGRCGKCEYVNVSHQEQSLSKIPLPDEFLPGSQIQVSCNDTSRLFAGDGFNIDGPRDSAVFTCVAGNWVGAGEWQLENLSCQGCLQVGTSSLQTLSNVSLVAAYFLEHRQIQVTYAEAIPGCLSAIEPTAATVVSLVSSHQQLDISTDNKTVTCPKKSFDASFEAWSNRSWSLNSFRLNLGSIACSQRKVTISRSSQAIWWIDLMQSRLRVKSPRLPQDQSWCLCKSETSEDLIACSCDTWWYI